jgi:RNA polymerase sigma factor (sigma-70 family)
MGKGKFKYDVVKGSSVGAYEELPRCFLADTPEEAEKLYKDYYTLLNNISYTYSISTNIDKSDLFGEALIGLARAKRDFDPTRSDNFKAFAIYKIKWALNEYVRKNSRSVIMPAYIRNANRQLTTLKESFNLWGLDTKYIDNAVETGVLDIPWAKESPLKEKIMAKFELLVKGAERAGITVKELVARAEYVPTDVPYDEYATCVEMLEEQTRKLHMSLKVKEMKRFLTPSEIRICEGIMEDKSYDEIAKEFGRTAPWVKQQLNKIKERLTNRR